MLGKKPVHASNPYRYHVHSEEAAASARLAVQLSEQLQHVPTHRELIIVCIGTDRSTGDSLGPLVGSSLEKKWLHRFAVYGTLEHPVHAVNLEETMEDIRKKQRHPYIIGVDACLGKLKNVGIINFTEGPVIPGAAMKKKLPEVGDMHLTGIVNVSGMMEYFVLQNTRLHLVMKMSDCISEAFIRADRKLKGHSADPVFQRSMNPYTRRNGSSASESALSLQDPK
ncbi:spore protease YyaC [Salibacterium halotolerans]|uniref:Putative sporulation protein YyaC n=1 Tax=Salibacterium halotolerans TaxID=1884432 RepID=A0A1I5U419_9BACI|nr:spore protease YyaC [Salibacterium halotolerans]SFP90019.1 putative sporulation protein YyaC [Salibacterium halotolerans]